MLFSRKKKFATINGELTACLFTTSLFFFFLLSEGSPGSAKFFGTGRDLKSPHSLILCVSTLCRQLPRRKLLPLSDMLCTSAPAEAISSVYFAFLSKHTVHLSWGCHPDKRRCFIHTVLSWCLRTFFTNY